MVVGCGLVDLWLLVLVVASFSCWLWPYAVVGCNHSQICCGVVVCGLVRLLVVATFCCWFWYCMVVGCGLVVVSFGFRLILLLVVAIRCYWL